MNDSIYISIETTRSILISLEILALAHKRNMELEKTHAENAGRAINNNINYNNVFSLLMLNAAIIEGTLRSLLSKTILKEIDDAIDKDIKMGVLGKGTKAEQLLIKYHSDIELQGGWEKLKEQYSFYFDVSLDKLMGKELKETINSLFILRNVIAHGTSIVSPLKVMNEEEKDLYPHNWQRKLQGATVYLERKFGKKNIFDNLSNHSLPEHFFTETIKLFQIIEKEFSPLPEPVFKTVRMVCDFKYGYCNYTK